MSFEMTTLGEFATVQGGYAYKSQDFKSTGEWSVLKIKNVRTGHVSYNDTSFVSTEVATATSKWATKPGDILISMTGSGPSAPESLVGRAARVWKGEKSALINQRVGRLILKESSNIDLDFLFYLLSLKESQDFLVSNSTGSANQVNISAKTIESVPCPKIDHDTSTDIASILLSLDGRIRLLRETNITLEAIAQVLFKSWFVDFDPVHAKQQGREPEGMDSDTAALLPDGFEESELGLVPSGWLTTTLNKVLITRNERVGELDVPEYSSTNQGLVPRSQLYNKQLAISPAKNKLVHHGDIVFGLSRKVLNFGFMQDSIGSVSSAYKVYRIDKNQIEPELLARLIRTRKDYFFNAVSASSREGQSVSDESLGVLGFACPPKYVQAALLNYMAPLLEQATLLLEQVETLSKLRDTLLPGLISGQLSLPESEAMIEKAT
jgi:type I restriction enzyme S subunit